MGRMDWDAMAFAWIRIAAVSPAVHEDHAKPVHALPGKKPPAQPRATGRRVDDATIVGSMRVPSGSSISPEATVNGKLSRGSAGAR